MESSEEWVEVPGFNGRYLINRVGQVRSTTRRAKLLKPLQDKFGYHFYVLKTGDGKNKSRKTHRLVALLFLENKDEKPCVNHLDGNKMNPAIDNLEWCTYSENEFHSYRVLGKEAVKHRLGKINSENPISKQVVQLSPAGKIIATYPSAAETERQGFIAECVRRVCRGNQALYKGFKWAYTSY